jgi:hypothetical protein
MKKFKQHLTTTFWFLFLAGCETVKTVGPDELANALPASTAIKVSDNQNAAKTESKPSVVASAVKPIEPELQPARPKPEQLLAEGSELYEKGDYKAAIRKLVTVRDSAEVTPLTKQSSLRLLAFSYCVTSQRALCKNQFSTLLAIAPEFQLSRGEAGHPLWGPVFKEAKSEKMTKPLKTTQKG